MWERERGKSKHRFRVNGDSEGGVEAGGDGSVGGVLGPVGDVSDGVAVDADAGDGAVDLESGLEIEDGAVLGEAHHDHRGRRRRSHRRRLLLRGLRQGEAALGGVVAGKVGWPVSLATHCCVVREYVTVQI